MCLADNPATGNPIRRERFLPILVTNTPKEGRWLRMWDRSR